MSRGRGVSGGGGGRGGRRAHVERRSSLRQPPQPSQPPLGLERAARASESSASGERPRRDGGAAGEARAALSSGSAAAASVPSCRGAVAGAAAGTDPASATWSGARSRLVGAAARVRLVWRGGGEDTVGPWALVPSTRFCLRCRLRLRRQKILRRSRPRRRSRTCPLEEYEDPLRTTGRRGPYATGIPSAPRARGSRQRSSPPTFREGAISRFIYVCMYVFRRYAYYSRE